MQAISNVTLVKASDRRSEQTFSVDITFSNPLSQVMAAAATLSAPDTGRSYDYLVTRPGVRSVRILFPSDQQIISVSFFLNGDTEVEGLEAFRIISSPSSDYPMFQAPQDGAFENTEIQILDSNSKFTVSTTTSHASCLSNFTICKQCDHDLMILASCIIFLLP